jgi:hypothetical protein
MVMRGGGFAWRRIMGGSMAAGCAFPVNHIEFDDDPEAIDAAVPYGGLR